MKKAIALILAVVMLIGVLAGCGGSSNTAANNTAKPAKGGTLRLAISEDIDTLNPHIERSSQDVEVIWLVGGVLYRLKPGTDSPYEIVPEYADGEPQMMDADGLVWKIAVRKDAKWSDGAAMTAADFEYSLKMFYDPILLNAPGSSLDEYGIYIKNASEYYTQVKDGKNISWDEVGVKLLADENAIELTLSKPVNASQVKLGFAAAFMCPVRQDVYEAGLNETKDETSYGSAADKYACAGPFMVTGWTRDQSISMVRNPNYPLADLISIDGVEYTIVPEAATRMQLFEQGKIDKVSLTNADMEKYGEDPRILEVPGGGVVCIGINMISEKNPALQNEKFRQALFFGTNRVEASKLGNNIPADYYITEPYIVDINSGLAYRDTDAAKSYVDAKDYSYNPEKAKALMEEALKELNVTSASIEILYQDSNTTRKEISEYLQKSWQNLFGADKLTVTLQSMASSALSSLYRSHTENPNAFESGIIASTYNYLDPASALKEWSKDASRKKIPYYNDEFSDVYNKLVALPLSDVEGRIKLTAEAEAIMLEDAPFVPVCQTVERVLIASRVTLPYDTYNSVLRYAWAWVSITE